LVIKFDFLPHISEKKGKSSRNVVVASLFGVGAPEALVIGVVALLVFGPKGLAEVL
jgi:mttA/Hcf106 family